MAEQPVAAQIVQHFFAGGDYDPDKRSLLVRTGQQVIQQKLPLRSSCTIRSTRKLRISPR
ncbi:hypothetical protein D3C76_1523150 [compost metagenome]